MTAAPEEVFGIELEVSARRQIVSDVENRVGGTREADIEARYKIEDSTHIISRELTGSSAGVAAEVSALMDCPVEEATLALLDDDASLREDLSGRRRSLVNQVAHERAGSRLEGFVLGGLCVGGVVQVVNGIIHESHSVINGGSGLLAILGGAIGAVSWRMDRGGFVSREYLIRSQMSDLENSALRTKLFGLVRKKLQQAADEAEAAASSEA